MDVFVSHISEEAALALVLKDWIESTFLGQCKVFVSSDSGSLPPGARWLDQIDAALQAANVMVVLCSSASVQRPWVNFETGCAWSRNIAVVPVCHSGLTKGTLPRPLAEFQGLDATDPRFPSAFLAAIAQHLGVAKLPRLDATAMNAELSEAIAQLEPTASKGEPKRIDLQAEVASLATSLPEEAIQMLEFLARQSTAASTKQLMQVSKTGHQKTEYCIDKLKDAGLVDMHLVMGDGAYYKLSKKGRDIAFGASAA